MEKEIINLLTKDEIEILRTILLERSTFYTSKIVDNRVLQSRSYDGEIFDVLQADIDYDFKRKNAIDKLYKILSQKKENN